MSVRLMFDFFKYFSPSILICCAFTQFSFLFSFLRIKEETYTYETVGKLYIYIYIPFEDVTRF